MSWKPLPFPMFNASLCASLVWALLSLTLPSYGASAQREPASASHRITAGRALGADGEPLTGRKLYAVPLRRTQSPNEFEWLPWEPTGADELAAKEARAANPNAGVLFASSELDMDGSFEFADLRTGSYRVYALPFHSGAGGEVQALGEPLRAGNRGARLRFPVTELEVRLVDELGEPLVIGDRNEGSWRPKRAITTTVHIARLSPSGWPYDSFGLPASMPSPDATLRWQVRAGERYALVAVAPDRTPVTRIWTAPTQATRVLLELQLGPKVPGSTISLQDLGGLNKQLEVRELRTGVLLEQLDLGTFHEYTFGLPAGRYALIVTCLPKLPWCISGHTFKRSRRVPPRREIEVSRGEHLTLPMKLERGGRLALRYDLPVGDDASLNATVARWKADEFNNRDYSRLPGGNHPHAITAEFRLPPDKSWRQLTFFYPESAFPSELGQLIPGRECLTFDMLAAGTYELRLQAPGEEPVLREVEVRVGETTQLILLAEEAKAASHTVGRGASVGGRR